MANETITFYTVNYNVIMCIFRGQRWILLTYHNTCGQDIRFIHNQHKQQITPLNTENCKFNLDWACSKQCTALRHPILLKIESGLWTCSAQFRNGNIENLLLSNYISPYLSNQKSDCTMYCDLWCTIQYYSIVHVRTKWHYNKKAHRTLDVNMN